MTKSCWLTAALIGLQGVPAYAQSLPESAAIRAETNAGVPGAAAPEAAESATASAAAEHEKESGAPALSTSVSHVGGYGGPSVLYSRVAGSDGVLVGGEGAVLLDHRLAFGGGGYGWTCDASGPADVDGVPRKLEMGYGGALVRYSVLTGSLLYGSVGALIGAGGVTLRRDTEDETREEARQDATDSFFVFEPQLSLQVNLLRWMRLGLQSGYRITSGVGHVGYTESDINGLTLGGTLQFGSL